MTRSAGQLRRLLHDLLTAARLQARRLDLDRTTVELATHVEQVVATLRQSVGEIELGVSVHPDLRVHADPVRLTQILDNLVLNAVRHGRPPVRVGAAEVDGLVELSVRDAGDGVDAEIRPRLFERFATGSSRGTGLGLFLVRELARAHGGDATYRVEDGAFVVTLPRGESG
jgi:signal transduction histidine kinase